MALFDWVLRENRFTPELVPTFEQKLFYEGARRRAYLEQFGVLLCLSVVIATMSIIGDSTAGVIGAMIVAPLMTPIMATAAALVTGRMDRAFRSLLLVGTGVGSVVALSWLLGLLVGYFGGVLSFETNSQITGRISPRFIDLIAAMASGAAGAFCMSREDVSDSLPGVAIAISLVPPLCVVGLSLSYGAWGAAGGAFLLFITNFLAILLAGGGLLATIGLSHAATVALTGRGRQYAYVAIIVAMVFISLPLLATGRALNDSAREQQQAQRVAERWAAGTGFTLRGVQTKGNGATVIISGPPSASPPSMEALAAVMAQAVGRPMIVEVEVVPSYKQRTTGQPDAAPSN